MCLSVTWFRIKGYIQHNKYVFITLPFHRIISKTEHYKQNQYILIVTHEYVQKFTYMHYIHELYNILTGCLIFSSYNYLLFHSSFFSYYSHEGLTSEMSVLPSCRALWCLLNLPIHFTTGSFLILLVLGYFNQLLYKINSADLKLKAIHRQLKSKIIKIQVMSLDKPSWKLITMAVPIKLDVTTKYL